MTEGMEKPKARRSSRAGGMDGAEEKSPKSVKAGPGTNAGRAAGKDASRLIDAHLQNLGGWRAETLAELRRLIHEADPDVTEEWKWMGTPVWSHDGNICTGESYKQVVKLTFARGASLEGPWGLFNSSLEGNARRAIDVREGEAFDPEAFKALIQAAVVENLRSTALRSKASAKTSTKAKSVENGTAPFKAPGRKKDAVVLLSGGNPQIARADGDAPVQAYIDAMPGWKRDVGRRLDALIMNSVPNVRKAVKWNSPLYGVEGQGWFLGLHVFTHYVKVAFFRGTSLRPAPPEASKSGETRYLNIREGDSFDETLFASWVKQAAVLPGWTP